jgi:hypothetical protein
MLFWETLTVYCENSMNTQMHYMGRMQSFSVLKQVVGTYSDHWALNG